MTGKLYAPARSLAQRMEALDEANRIRSYRAGVKRDLKAGRKGFVELLDDRDCETMKVIDALLALPKIGRVKADKALRRVKVSPAKTLGGMTRRQRDELLAELAGSPVARVLVAA